MMATSVLVVHPVHLLGEGLARVFEQASAFDLLYVGESPPDAAAVPDDAIVLVDSIATARTLAHRWPQVRSIVLVESSVPMPRMFRQLRAIVPVAIPPADLLAVVRLVASGMLMVHTTAVDMASVLNWAKLTAREREVVQFVSDGLTNQDIADNLNITLKTVESHLRNSYRKLGITGRDDLFTEDIEDSEGFA